MNLQINQKIVINGQKFIVLSRTEEKYITDKMVSSYIVKKAKGKKTYKLGFRKDGRNFYIDCGKSVFFENGDVA